MVLYVSYCLYSLMMLLMPYFCVLIRVSCSVSMAFIRGAA